MIGDRRHLNRKTMRRIRGVLFICLSAVIPVYGQITLSEIMFNPSGNERYDEYIEIFNNQVTDTIDLCGWLVSDGQKFNVVVGHPGALLPPQQYAVIFVPNYYDKSLSYEDQLPSETIRLTIDRASFGAYGLSNSEGETISLYSPDTVLVSSWTYTVPNADGFSEEKKVLEFPNYTENWGNSHVMGGTPGAINSNTPLPRDLALIECEILRNPETPSKDDSLNGYFRVKNEGRSPVDEFFFEIHRINNGKPDQLIQSTRVNLDSFTWNDSTDLVFVLPPLMPGLNKLFFMVRFEGDDNEENDILFRDIAVRADRGDIVINEIMCYTESSDQEWIELYNPSSFDIDLGQWKIKDRGKCAILIEESFHIKAESYTVLSRKSLMRLDKSVNLLCLNLPELNNSSDEVVLLDATSAVIDSVHYTFSGTNRDRFVSLERIRYEEASHERSNWALCRDVTGSTPGRLNSVSPRSYDLELKSLNLSLRSPFQGESCNIEATVCNGGRSALDEIRIRFFLALHSIAPLRPIGEAMISGLIEPRAQRTAVTEWRAMPPGRHTVCAVLSQELDLVAQNDTAYVTCTVSYPTEVVVLNEIMYRPAPGLGEWVELVNPQTFTVNIAGWIFSDGDTSRGFCLCDSTLFIESEHFLVICKDSSVIQTNPELPCVVDSRFPSLSNEQDSLFVYDGNGRLIEELHYRSGWGGKIGRSLERINPLVPSSSPWNWSTCVHSLGHTLGKPNSILTGFLTADVSFSVSPNPFSPDSDGFEDMLAIVFQLPIETAAVNLKIYDSKGRMVRFLQNNEPSGSRMTLFWDGLDDNGQRCRIGIYILSLQALNVSRCEIHRGWTTVVLAGWL